MADYYPLLSRAVSALPASTPESRRAIYDRAGTALLGQLKAIQPPIPQGDIEREEKALREAIDRIEAELAPTLSPEAAAAAAVEKALMELGMPASNPAPPAAPPAGPVAPRPPGTPSVAVRPPPAATGRAQEAPAGAPDDLDRPVRPAGPAVTATAPKAQRPGATSGRLESGRSKKSAVMLFGGLGLIIAVVAGGIGFYAWKTRLTPDQMRQGRATSTAPAAISAPTPSPVATPEPAPAATPEPAPPRVETRATNRVPQNGQPEPVSPEPSAAPAEPAPRTPTQSAAVEPAPQQAGIPVAQRAAILMAAPTQENPQNVQTYIGTVVWRTDTITRGPGQPAASAVRADIDIPDAKFSAVMTIEKNTDATLPASHTVTWRFTRSDDSPIPEIAETDTMQMRDETSPQVDPLLGARARITTNIFIIALASGDAASKRNVDLMEKKGWFDLPVRTSDNRLAKITLEKGSPGEKIMLEALARWAN